MNILSKIISIILSFFTKQQKMIDVKFPEISVKNPFDMFSITIPFKSASMSGSEFAKKIMNIGPNQQREDLIFEEYKNGNVPDFMRSPIEVLITENENSIRYLVLPDVLCIGDNNDYLRTPINPLTAKKIANLFGCVLPTRKMANQIWQAATVKLEPSPNGPPYDASMQSTEKMVFHNEKIKKALDFNSLGELVTGHKKDVVISKLLESYPKNVAIYGWFYSTGKPIQGLNPKDHDNLYKDYSHGIRMISRKMLVNNVVMDFYDILKDPKLSSLISDEGSYNAEKMYG